MSWKCSIDRSHTRYEKTKLVSSHYLLSYASRRSAVRRTPQPCALDAVVVPLSPCLSATRSFFIWLCFCAFPISHLFVFVRVFCDVSLLLFPASPIILVHCPFSFVLFQCFGFVFVYSRLLMFRVEATGSSDVQTGATPTSSTWEGRRDQRLAGLCRVHSSTEVGNFVVETC